MRILSADAISICYIEEHALELLKSEFSAYRFKSLIFPRSIQSKFHALFYPIKLTNPSNWLQTICSISFNYPAGLKKYVVYDTLKLFLIGILL